MKGRLLRQVLDRYAKALRTEGSKGTRAFLQVRARFTPYEVMASRLPPSGRILDVGSGHGILSLTLALEGPERTIEGVDHDEARVKLARGAAVGLPNLTFRTGNALESAPSGAYDGIAIIDVLHYFSETEQARILSQAFSALKSGGVLIFREVNPQAGAVSRWNRLYEKIATATRFTRSEKHSTLHFRSPEGWHAAASSAGFVTRSEPCSHPLFADVLFVCRKPEARP